MDGNQIETSELRSMSYELRVARISRDAMHRRTRPTVRRRLGSTLETRNSNLVPSAFTLTELLVVITIIAILAGLLTGAVMGAMRRARQAAITLDIQQLAGSIEDFKNEIGAYPPNGMHPTGVKNNAGTFVRELHRTDFELMFRKAFPRHQEPIDLIRKLIGDSSVPGTGTMNAGLYLENGMSGAESLVFWLGGVSEDTQFPISGPGGPSFALNLPNALEDLTSRNYLYEFELGRLGPRNSDNRFDDSATGGGRFIEYRIDLNGNGNTTDQGEFRRINFWRYTPSKSVEPIVYFDTSRHRAQVQNNAGNFVNNYDPWFYSDGTVTNPELRYALKQFNETGGSNRVEFVNQGKFQLLHCGIDDLWGDGFGQAINPGDPSMWIGETGNPTSSDLKLFPTGPFVSEVADTVSNFFTGTLADEQE